jgi:prepilin-type processing-associated H-X9-DG protein
MSSISCQSRRPVLGFTVIELMVVLGVISVLVGFSLPAIQSVREVARNAECMSRLRQLVIASIAHESSFRFLPQGTLGYAESLEWDDFRNTPDGPYWKKVSHTSVAVLLLPYLEDRGQDLVDRQLYDRSRHLSDYIDPSSGNQIYDWFGEIRGFKELAARSLTAFACPSDSIQELGNSVEYAGGSQPVCLGGIDSDWFSYIDFLKVNSGETYVGTNYGGCAGPYSGGIHPHPERNRFQGAMTSGEKRRLKDLRDGLSHTILLGETVGNIENGSRNWVHPWNVGGLLRIRGNIPWMSGALVGQEHIGMLGDSRNSAGFGFGSMHPSVVNVAMADGSVQSLDRGTNWRLLYQLAGCHDGEVTR